jgi:hypothetical protein
MLAAATLQIQGEEQVTIPIVGATLPPTCTARQFLGIDCPGCGLTRCFISVAHGDIGRAWGFNPAGILLFGFVAAQIPYRAMQIWRMSNGRNPLRFDRLTVWLLYVAAGGLFIQWMIRHLIAGSGW